MERYLAQAIEEPTGGMAGWALDLIDTLGGLGLALLCALDSMVSIIPADMVMPIVGFSATHGTISLGAAIVWTTSGSVAGSLVLYILGARLGRDRARALVIRIPRVEPAAVDRVEAWFARHGAKAVMFGRMLPLPGVRTFISIPAGVERMSPPKFVILTAIGSLVWNSTLLVAGYQLGENWHRVTDVTGNLKYVIIAVIVVIAVLVLRRRARRRAKITPVIGDNEPELG